MKDFYVGQKTEWFFPLMMNTTFTQGGAGRFGTDFMKQNNITINKMGSMFN